MNHELITLRPAHPDTKRDIAWQAMMVEFGVDFAFNERHELPDTLPDDMSGVRAVAIDCDSWKTYISGPMGEQLRAFGDAGGVITSYAGPDNQSPMDESATRGCFDMMVASAGLTLNHPRTRDRLRGRSFRQLYEALVDPYFEGQINAGLTRGPDIVYSEPYAFNTLYAMESFAEYDPGRLWSERLRSVLDQVLAMPEPSLENIDHLTPLPVFVRLSNATGDRRYRDLAAKLTRKVATDFPRIAGVTVLQPVRDRYLWNECLAHFPPVCVAVGDDDLVKLAIHTAHTIHDLNYDPVKKLWYHWGAPGRRGPALWARGQAWALTGLVGVLQHLDASHPDRPALIQYVNEIIAGLSATQNDEGLWHNVLDMPDMSRVATRATAMFVYLLSESRRAGWIDERADDMLHRAWRGVRGRMWRDKLCSVCCGTGAAATLQHYLSRPMLFYGSSAAMRAGAAYVLAYGDNE